MKFIMQNNAALSMQLNILEFHHSQVLSCSGDVGRS